MIYKKNIYWIFPCSLVILLDRISKCLALIYLEYLQPVVITPFFNLTLAYNRGVAFGLFNSTNGLQSPVFTFIAIVVSAGLLFWLLRLKPNQRLEKMGIVFIMGGALGNVSDRIVYGYVIDYFHLHIGEWSWPIFNVADSFICMGAGLLLLSSFLDHRSTSNSGTPTA